MSSCWIRALARLELAKIHRFWNTNQNIYHWLFFFPQLCCRGTESDLCDGLARQHGLHDRLSLLWFSLWTDDNKLSTRSRTYFEEMSPLRWAKMERSRKLCIINLVHPFIEREILVLNNGVSFKLCCYNLDEEISFLQTNKNTFFFTS